jgi:hypothetical protein
MAAPPDAKRARRAAGSASPSSSGSSGSEAEEDGVDARTVLSLRFVEPGATDADASGAVAATAAPLYTHQIFEDDMIGGHEGEYGGVLCCVVCEVDREKCTHSFFFPIGPRARVFRQPSLPTISLKQTKQASAST